MLNHKPSPNSPPIASPSSQPFATTIIKKDEIKILKKKISILKDSILQTRQTKNKLAQHYNDQQQKIKSLQMQAKKKEYKYELLAAQIKILRDSLIVERNQKVKLFQMIEQSLDGDMDRPNLRNKASSSFLSYFKL